MDTKSQSQYPRVSYIEIQDLYSSEKCIMWSFYRQELPSCPQGHICDVIGVVIFVGRPERVRKKGKMFGIHKKYSFSYANRLKYFSLQMGKGQRSRSIDGSNWQIEHQTSQSRSSFSPRHSLTFKAVSIQVPRHCIFSLLFSVSVLLLQTNCIVFCFFNSVALLVCTRLKLIRSAVDRATTFEYLTNTSLTQIYCTGK